MENLVDLKNALEVEKPKATAKATPIVREERGDDVMAKAQGFLKVNDEETRFAKLVMQSDAIIRQRAESDPEYSQAIGTQLSGINDHEAKANFLIDEADKLKIETLSQNPPPWWKEGNAQTYAFLNEATFGQLSKIYGKVGETIQGRPYEEVVEEQAERIRLLKKAFPKSALAADAAAYLIPGSPAKALFTKAASLGAKAGASMLAKVAGKPKLIESVIKSATAGGAGAAAVGGVTGTLGTDLQEISFDRGVEHSLLTGTVGFVGGGALPAAGAGITSAIKASAPTIRATARSFSTGVAKQVEELSGTPKEALKASLRDPKGIAKAYGTEFTRSQRLLSRLEAIDDSALPERMQADQLLENFESKVSAAPLVRFLRSTDPGLDPQLEPQARIVKQWADNILVKLGNKSDGVTALAEKQKALNEQVASRIKLLQESIARKRAILSSTLENRGKNTYQAVAKQQDPHRPLLKSSIDDQFQETLKPILSDAKAQNKSLDKLFERGMKEISLFRKAEEANLEKFADQTFEDALSSVSPSELRKIVDQMQVSAKKFYGKDAPFAKERIMEAAALGRRIVLDAATGEGERGALYTGLMERVAAKRNVVDFLLQKMGKSEQSREINAKRFYKNIFGTNNEITERRLLELDKHFGTSFWDEAKQAHFANQLGEGGVPQLLPQQRTGRSLLGVVLGAAVKGPVGAVTVGAASSPKVGAALIGASDKITGFVHRMVANPDALARLAGRIAAKGPPGAEKQLAQLRVPVEVRRIANEIYSTLLKDGPVSAGSVTRVVADSPYFIGLVHYFEVADRQMKSKDLEQGLTRMKEASPGEIATPRN